MRRYFYTTVGIVGLITCGSIGYSQGELPVIDTVKRYSETDNNLSFVLDDNDYFSRSIENMGDIDGNGYTDLAVGAGGDDDAGTNNGAVYILFFNDTGIIDTTKILAPSSLATGSWFGGSLENLGDIDGNGVNDLAVGAPYDEMSAGINSGSINILYLNSNGTYSSHFRIGKGLRGFTGTSINQDDDFGFSIASLGDIDGDTYLDIAVGMPADDPGGSTDKGAFYVLNLDDTLGVIGETYCSVGSGFSAADLSTTSKLGYAMTAVGDINEDGTTDLLVAGPFFDGSPTASNNSGAVFLVKMNANGSVKSQTRTSIPVYKDTRFITQGEEFGRSLAYLGDINSDRIDEVLIGGADYDITGTEPNRGAFYIASIDSSGNILAIRKYGTGLANFQENLSSQDYFGGSSLCTYPDTDSNSVAELMIGMFGHGTYEGAFYHVKYEFLDEGPAGTARWFQEHNEYSGFEADSTPVDLTSGDYFGICVDSLGDLNNDGWKDIVVGAYRDDAGGTDRGAVHIMFLDSIGSMKSSVEINSNTTNFTGNLGNSDRFGVSAAALGDLNSSGVQDLAIGAFLDDDGGTNTGAVYILFLDTAGGVDSTHKISSTSGDVTGLGNDDRFGRAVANIGDVDGDGITDLAVTATNDDDGGTNRGAVYILFMNADGSVSSQQKISDTQGNFSHTFQNGAAFGVDVSGIGDIDDDDIPDIAVTWAYNTARDGGLFIIRLNSTGTVKSYNYIDTAEVSDMLVGDYFGWSVTGVEDLNGDGFRDVVVGGIYDDGGDYSGFSSSKTGALWSVFIDSTGQHVGDQKISVRNGRFGADVNPDDRFGSGVAVMGDVDGDTYPEIVVGEYLDDASATDAGAAYVMSLSKTFKPTEPYAETSSRVDGSYYIAKKGQLRLRYQEEYNDQDDALTYKIYDFKHSVVASHADVTQSTVYGDNRLMIKLNCNGVPLAQGFYTLEIQNEKNEKRFLRFYQEDDYSSCW